MSAQNQTLLEMVNDIGVKLTGKIPGTQSRPTKLEIVQALNDAQDAVCGEKSAYSFLQKNGDVKAWLPAVGTDSYYLGLPTTISSEKANLNPTTDNVGTTTYIAEAFVQPGGTCAAIKTVGTLIYGLPAGFGALEGTFNCYAVGFTKLDFTNPNADQNAPNGVPDMNNILATATPVTVTNDVFSTINPRTGSNYVISDGAEIPLTFNFDSSVAVGSNQLVYIVISWTTAPLNGSSFSWGKNSTKFSDNSYLWTNSAYPTQVFSAVTPSLWYMTLITQHAVFASSPIGLLTVGGIADYAGTNTNNREVLLPADCRTVSRIYNPSYALYMNPISYDAYKYRPMQQPGNTFVISGEDANGVLKAILFPSVNYVLNYKIDYTAMPSKMVDDADISIVPKEYRAILKNKAIMQLVALNNGINIDTALFEADYVRLLAKMNEAYLPYSEISMSVNIGGITDNNAPSRDYLNNTNVLNEYPNSWHENKAGNGRPGGGY